MKKEEQKDFKILDDISHVLLRPAIYIGSTSIEKKELFLNYNYASVHYNPGLFKIVNELIDNSVDEYTRTQGKFADKIDIDVTDTTFTVLDNGRGIPVDKVKDVDGSDIYRPQAAWCKTKAGSNFNDDANRVTAGMNGVGSALSNIFSKKFHGETSDGSQKFVVECVDNAKIVSVKVTKSTKKYTKVTIQPDFQRFSLEKFDETMIKLIEDRIVGLAVAYPNITFKFNGTPIKMGTPKAYVSKFGENAIVYSDENVILGFMPSPEAELRYHSVVNGLTLYSGGSHIDYIMNGVVATLREGIKKKHKFDIMPAQIKSHIQLVSVIRNFKNMKFDSQTKERLTNTSQEVAEHLSHVDYENIAKQILKNEAILMPIIETQLAKQRAADLAEERKKNNNLKKKKVAKHIPATSSIFEKKTLFITEGDSAIGQFVSVRNSETQGAIPLRGKILNTFDKSNKEILSSGALSELMVVLGLELGKPAKTLNYGTIAITTDQDVDGFSIRCLLINFFYNWPELFEHGRVKILNSPRYILRSKKQRHYFYDKTELDAFKGSTSGYELAYIKGLGSLRIEEYKDIISDPYYETIVIDDVELFNMMYGKDANLRKKYMME
jgi:DNA topoisomerase-2